MPERWRYKDEEHLVKASFRERALARMRELVREPSESLGPAKENRRSASWFGEKG